MAVQFSSVQLLSHVQLFATLWSAAHQASLSITDSQNCGSVRWLISDINLTGLWDAQIFGWTLKTKRLTLPWVRENSSQVAFELEHLLFFPCFWSQTETLALSEFQTGSTSDWNYAVNSSGSQAFEFGLEPNHWSPGSPACLVTLTILGLLTLNPVGQLLIINHIQVHICLYLLQRYCKFSSRPLQ